MKDNQVFDVIIIGGSYAGLSAAMALGRSLKRTLIIDSGKPCNRYTPHSQNFITHDGAVPGEIAAAAREQVFRYDTVKLHQDVATLGRKTDAGFEISTQSGMVFAAKKLLFATGVRDLFPEIPGFEDCWGKTVIHCPYCHGYEFRGKKTAILAQGERAFHLAAMVRNLTDQLTVMTQGAAALTAAQLARLHDQGIGVLEQEVTAIGHQQGRVNALTLGDGTVLEVEAVYAAIPFGQHCEIPVALGCEVTETGHIRVDAFQKTSVPGVYACGDCTSPMRAVANAVSAGNLAGAMVNSELTMEQF